MRPRLEQVRDLPGPVAGRMVPSPGGSEQVSIALCTEAMETAKRGDDHRQACYHAINVAFPRLVYRSGPESAAATARIDQVFRPETGVD